MREFSLADLNGHRLRIGHSDGPVRPPDAAGEKQVRIKRAIILVTNKNMMRIFIDAIVW